MSAMVASSASSSPVASKVSAVARRARHVERLLLVEQQAQGRTFGIEERPQQMGLEHAGALSHGLRARRPSRGLS